MKLHRFLKTIFIKKRNGVLIYNSGCPTLSFPDKQAKIFSSAITLNYVFNRHQSICIKTIAQSSKNNK
jgi:hypothetical protein